MVRHQLGPVRDLDVQIQRMRDIAASSGVADAAIDPYVAWLEVQRESVRLSARQKRLNHGALGPSSNACSGSTNGPPTSASNPTVSTLPCSKIRSAPGCCARSTNSQTRGRRRHRARGAELHAVRIRAKRLRYTAEFFEPAYGKPAQRLVERVVALQDLLGNLQDGVVSREHIARKQSNVGRRLARVDLARPGPDGSV